MTRYMINQIILRNLMHILIPFYIVCSSYGPLGKDVDSLVIAMKAMCVPEMSLLDPTIPYKPFNMEVNIPS